MDRRRRFWQDRDREGCETLNALPSFQRDTPHHREQSCISQSSISVESLACSCAYSGSRGLLTPSPHTTHHAGPQWAVHAKFNALPHGLRTGCAQGRRLRPTPNSIRPVGFHHRVSSRLSLHPASHVRPFAFSHSREALKHYYGLC